MANADNPNRVALVDWNEGTLDLFPHIARHAGYDAQFLKVSPSTPPKEVAEFLRKADPLVAIVAENFGTGKGEGIDSVALMKRDDIYQRLSSGLYFLSQLPAHEQRARETFGNVRYIKKDDEDKLSKALISHKKLDILVADDDPELRSLIAEILENLGANPSIASSGNEAIEIYGSRLKNRPFDGVFTDLSMKNGTGVDLARHIENSSRKTPVVLVSGFEANQEYLALMQQSNSVPFIGSLQKPFKISQIGAYMEGMRRYQLDLQS